MESNEPKAGLFTSQNFVKFLQFVTDGIIVIDKTGIILFSNEQAKKIFGYTEKQLVGKPLSLLVPKRYRQKHEASCQNFFLKPGVKLMGSMHKELVGLRKDGTEFPIDVGLSPVKLEEKMICITIIRDITERVKEEKALEESRRQLNTVVSNAPIVLFAVDKKGVFTLSEGKGLEALGLKPGEAVGQSASEMYRDNPSILESIHLALKGKESIATVEVGDLVYETHYWPLRDKKNNLVGVTGLANDITERKRAEEQRVQAEKALRKSYKESQLALEGTVNVLSATAEKRDPYTGGHQERVAKLAYAIAKEMNLPRKQAEGTRVAGLLHDIGKISVPIEILSKPGKIEAEEFELIKKHPQEAYEILKEIKFPWPVAQAALQHLERIDGSGYPRKLKGAQIIIEAKIIAVADVVEAMASHRPYRPALGADAAITELLMNKGKLYDSQVVDACVRLFKEKGFKLD